MQVILQRFLFFIAFVLLLTACEREDVTFLPNGSSAFPSEAQVEASFYGRLLNQNLEPVIDAEVLIGARSTRTDSLGDWIIPAVDVVGNQAYVRVEAQGYYSASRVLSVLPKSMNAVRIMAIQKQQPTAIQTSTGGEVLLEGDSKITFLPDAFVYENGSSYSGEVKVFAHAIDGRTESSFVQMPGRLESTTSNAALLSFGMVAVELETPGGEKLQLREGYPATIRFAQANLEANAPDEVPLWHFDEGLGTWVEEGTSVKEGNYYVGTVAHFTWWNCDWPEDVVDFCIQFECSEFGGNTLNKRGDNLVPLFITALIINDLGSRETSIVQLNDDYSYCDILPANSTIRISFIDSIYNEIIGFDFETATEDIDFGTHEIPCDDIIGSQVGPLFPPIPAAPTPAGPAPNCLLVWDLADCESADQNILIRVSSMQFNWLPTIINQSLTGASSVSVFIPAGADAIFSMIDATTGEVIGRKRFTPFGRNDFGLLNPQAGTIGAKSHEIEGRLQGCNDPLGNISVRLHAEDGRLIDETKSSASGKFTLSTEICDASAVALTIVLPQGEQIMGLDIVEDTDLGEIKVCTADGNYFWNAIIDGRQFTYFVGSGRAGVDGWAAYASLEPDATAPLFSLTHDNRIFGPGTFEVGPNRLLEFYTFRLGGYEFNATDAVVTGELVVTEYSDVAAGVFTGIAVDAAGDTIEMKVEMRFVKP